MTNEDLGAGGKGLALFSLGVGLAAGAGVYWVSEHWIYNAEDAANGFGGLIFVVSAAAAWLLLAERRDLLRPAPLALLIASLLAFITWTLMGRIERENLGEFPIAFWIGLAGPAAAFLMTTLAKSVVLGHGGRGYTAFFFHGLTLPLIAAGAAAFAGLSLLLLFAWAALLKSLGLAGVQKLFAEPWFFLPFLGAVGGLSVALIRGQDAVLGALRYIVLLKSRLLTPIMAVFALTLLLVVAVNGAKPVFELPYPGGLMLGLTLVAALVFNGVYQNGEGAPPPLWLRIPNIFSLLALPAYAGLAAYAFWLRVETYGLTPTRLAGLAMNGLAFGYALICLAGLVTELNWRGARWMPLIAPLNMAFAAIAAAVLIVLSSPLVNPWALSARSLERTLLAEKVPAADFDFDYMRRELGEYGAASLRRLAMIEDHPEAAAIRAEAARALADRPVVTDPNTETDEAANEPDAAIMDLPLSPGAPPTDSASPEAGSPESGGESRETP